MRNPVEMEIETAGSILRSMSNTIEEMERFWPASKRGSNASRQLESLKAQRAAALRCVFDALAALNEPTK